MEKIEEHPMLVAQGGSLTGRRWSLSDSIVIGREPQCDVIVEDRQVSRFHARLITSQEGTILEDLGSKNGTHYNGTLIDSPVVLKDGDTIQIALAQKFLYLASDATMPLTEQLESQKRLRLDVRSRRVWILNRLIVPPLSALQFQLLRLLHENQGGVVSRQKVVSTIWGDEQAEGVTDQAVDALVRRLRDRLSEVDKTHVYISTVRGHGLRLDNPPFNDNS